MTCEGRPPKLTVRWARWRKQLRLDIKCDGVTPSTSWLTVGCFHRKLNLTFQHTIFQIEICGWELRRTQHAATFSHNLIAESWHNGVVMIIWSRVRLFGMIDKYACICLDSWCWMKYESRPSWSCQGLPCDCSTTWKFAQYIGIELYRQWYWVSTLQLYSAVRHTC